MPVLTTCIGSYPKPPYVPRMNWMHEDVEVGEVESRALTAEEQRAAFDRATREVVAEQAAIGIDIPTDGEMRRANYIHYHCRHLDGFEPDTLTVCTMRNGAWTAEVPTFTGRITAGEPFLARDWEVAQTATDKPVKITVPGPLTISDSTANAFYPDRRSWCADLASALNVEIRSLAAAGCRHIQVDEPLFARLPDEALDFGIENLERCFHGVPGVVTRTVHMCCGYPD
ncbi:MAG: 5-methyltetrahydropteroyltriglutamate--homocysteine methyltransferase, partial [Alphaproteobacteria bacterium]|nr:5-methyltetrahydropteroyltriglutamate--homocysteine methyltransferase [Alphaproteobacteria bacterium]